MLSPEIQNIQTVIAPLREQIIQHPIYRRIQSLEDLKIFMKYHVYAVWDFMSLLKALQNRLTCTQVPWFPTENPSTRFLINEIVVGEESDVDAEGNRKSHYELYLDAMTQCNAEIEPIQTFTQVLQNTGNFTEAYQVSNTPQAAQKFVDFTFEVIGSGKDYLQSAIFTFGREDLIPGMFISLVSDLAEKFPAQISIFKYYLERHIEVDGDYHSHLALEMTASLCSKNPVNWEEALYITQQSLQHRIVLWDAALAEMVVVKGLV